MRVAIVHDDLVQWGGAERVLLGLCEVYPDAPIFTSVFDKNSKVLKDKFGSKKIITSFLNSIPRWRSMYKALLPLYPIAFEQFVFDDFDLVISHTTRFAKAIITKPKTLHICYCHSPPRFLWRLSDPKNYGILEFVMSKLRIYDRVSSARVDHFIAGSKNAKKRIKKIYRRESRLVYPFIDLERFENVETFDGGYFLVIARQNEYKKVDLANSACKEIGIPLKIISGGLDDETIVKILAGCRALIIPGIEDFGLASLEAQALGKQVIAYKDGGALETVIDGRTGFLFTEQSVDSLVDALKHFNYANNRNRVTDCINNAKAFSKENFIHKFKQTVNSLLY